MNDRYKPGEGYHAVPPPYTGTFMPYKPDLVFNDAPTASESIAHVVNVDLILNKPSKDMSKILRPDAPIFEYWTFDSEDETEIEFVPKQKEPKNPKGGKILGKGKIKTGKSDFNDVYFVKCDKKNNVLFTNTECVVLSFDYKPPDEKHVLLRVPRENNMVLVTKPYNKTPYELLLGRSPSISFMRPFGCPITILNTLDPIGKFDRKADEGFLVGYSVNSKAFKVFNSRTRIVQETLHINFLKNRPNVAGIRPKWLFDIDTLTQLMNYQPIVAGNQPNHNASNKENLDADADVADAAFDVKENEHEVHVYPSGSDKTKKHDDKAKRDAKGKSLVNMPELEDIVYSDDEEVVGAEADLSNLETNIFVRLILTTRAHKDHPITQIIGDLTSNPQTRSMARMGHSQEEGIDYDEVFALVARIEAIKLFLAYASFMCFMVYHMDVKSAFLYETNKEEVYVCQPLGFKDPDYPDKVYKVVKALYGLHQAPRACQDKYLAKILRKFGFTDVKLASTPIETEKPLLKDLDGEDVDVRIYSDYAGANLDKKYTTRGFQFLGCRLIYWQCKKQTVVATSSTKAEYVAVAS
uniref:Retrovirus-related Pol polyprotein from transposon TNT 1-94 n=1 Tax=Tanacetum cinerariifolium TaxID=118510 RepID=A0A699IHQ7_TANCI|nr:retrovirus-related Pol polyprotein from transposon TNT 1-94 [Tanacetum cinerariifolium]